MTEDLTEDQREELLDGLATTAQYLRAVQISIDAGETIPPREMADVIRFGAQIEVAARLIIPETEAAQ